MMGWGCGWCDGVGVGVVCCSGGVGGLLDT